MKSMNFYFIFISSRVMTGLPKSKNDLFGLNITVNLPTFITITAQEFRIGINAGMDAARLSISGGSGGPLKTKAGLTAGITGEARISNVFGIQLEANYSSQGTGIITVDG
jgi:hypothetical protein